VGVSKVHGENQRRLSYTSAEVNKAVVGRFVEEVFVRASGDAMEDLIAEDFRSHAWAKDFGIPDGPEGVRQFIAVMDSAFSDAQVHTEDVLAEGDRVAVRYVYEADHTGELMGIGATGKRVSLPGIFIARVEGGKLAEYWRQEDHLGPMYQLGAM
jgi:predicted ester cyclase